VDGWEALSSPLFGLLQREDHVFQHVPVDDFLQFQRSRWGQQCQKSVLFLLGQLQLVLPIEEVGADIGKPVQQGLQLLVAALMRRGVEAAGQAAAQQGVFGAVAGRELPFEATLVDLLAHQRLILELIVALLPLLQHSLGNPQGFPQGLVPRRLLLLLQFGEVGRGELDDHLGQDCRLALLPKEDHSVAAVPEAVEHFGGPVRMSLHLGKAEAAPGELMLDLHLAIIMDNIGMVEYKPLQQSLIPLPQLLLFLHVD
jgi:hypothetical protein